MTMVTAALTLTSEDNELEVDDCESVYIAFGCVSGPPPLYIVVDSS